MHNYIWCPYYLPNFMKFCLVVSEELRWQTVWRTGQKQYVSPQKWARHNSLTLLLYCLHVYVDIVFLWSFWVGVNLYVFYTSIHWPCYCTVYMFMLSLFFFVVFLSWSKSVCFLYVHSLTLLLYCLHVYAVIVFLWSFWVGVNLYVFIRPFTDPVIVLSTCLCCHCFFCDLFEWQ
jgi:hypothetical protein